jgi:hypothetical protein
VGFILAPAKVVMDVGAGSSILSFFAVQAGARKVGGPPQTAGRFALPSKPAMAVLGQVYAVEASDMAIHARRLIEANGMSDRIVVLHGKLEELELPELVRPLMGDGAVAGGMRARRVGARG